MKHFNYRKKAILYFSLVLAVLIVSVYFFHHNSEKRLQTDIFYEKMELYADLINNALNKDFKNANDSSNLTIDFYRQSITEIVSLLPDDMRVSIILDKGQVIFDNEANTRETDNHKSRSEIMQARDKGEGKSIRESSTLDNRFCYYAKRFELPSEDVYYIRVALPYQIHYPGIFRSDNYFIYFLVILFILALPALLYFTRSISKSLRTLRDFIGRANRTGDYEGADFPDNEIGELSNEIKNTFIMLQKSKNQAQEEREKLLSHFSHSGEGIAFFSDNGEFSYANSHFIRLLNQLLPEPTYLLDSSILNQPLFEPIKRLSQGKSPHWVRFTETRNGSDIEVRGQQFSDGSFEIVLCDVTQDEQNKRIKHEMTNSIAHELRTPVSCIRGYIETLIGNPDMEEDKKYYFLERSYSQLLRLSELISDIATLTKIEEAAQLYPKSEVEVYPIIAEVKKDLQESISQQEMTFTSHVREGLKVHGNSSLLYTIFRNLVENSVRHAGKGCHIEISAPLEDDNFQYFSVVDDGVGIQDKEVLGKLFDRFFRVEEGRTRSNGGSGLGLSIVKNAIILHGGSVEAKQRPSGGLEIFFSIAKR